MPFLERGIMKRWDGIGLQVVVAAFMMLCGVVLHLAGLYSDILTLYWRDQLWRHPVPYFAYPLEYPVGIGLFIWLIGFVPGSALAYFLVTAVVLSSAGLFVVYLCSRFPGANPWLLALSPALVLYTVYNWDMLALLPTVAGLLLFRRHHDSWGMLLLTIAVWIKFFPIVIVPLVVFSYLLRGAWRRALRTSAIFVIVSIVMNAPVALQIEPAGLRLRPTWLYFFRFNQQRAREINLWNLIERLGIRLTTEAINTLSALLLGLGLGVALLLLWRGHVANQVPTQELVLPASLTILGWWLFLNKVYSPQYSLWLVVFLALTAAPLPLAIIFVCVDVISFVAFPLAVLQNSWADWVNAPVLVLPTLLREGTILAIVVWAAWRTMRPRRGWMSEPARTVRRTSVVVG